MNKKLKKELISVLAAPAPVRKEEFLNNMNYPKIRPYEFLLKQLGYIRIRNWICSLAAFSISFYVLLQFRNTDSLYKTLGIISSLFPFIALLTVTEITRSAAYRMAELEMTVRYSLSEVILSRLILLGAANLLLLLITTFLFAMRVEYGFIRIGIYLTVPCLLTGTASLTAFRLVRNREAIYMSSILCMLISCLCNLSTHTQLIIYQSRYFIMWISIFLLSGIVFFIQMKRLMKKSEELIWNSTLTA